MGDQALDIRGLILQVSEDRRRVGADASEGMSHDEALAAAMAMIAVAIVVSYVPVRRATTVDPMTALRCE